MKVSIHSSHTHYCNTSCMQYKSNLSTIKFIIACPFTRSKTKAIHIRPFNVHTCIFCTSCTHCEIKSINFGFSVLSHTELSCILILLRSFDRCGICVHMYAIELCPISNKFFSPILFFHACYYNNFSSTSPLPRPLHSSSPRNFHAIVLLETCSTTYCAQFS